MKLKFWLKGIFGSNETISTEELKKKALTLSYKWVKVFRGAEREDAFLMRLTSEKYVTLSPDGKTVHKGPKMVSKTESAPKLSTKNSTKSGNSVKNSKKVS